jgi:hypothetical protein
MGEMKRLGDFQLEDYIFCGCGSTDVTFIGSASILPTDLKHIYHLLWHNAKIPGNCYIDTEDKEIPLDLVGIMLFFKCAACGTVWKQFVVTIEGESFSWKEEIEEDPFFEEDDLADGEDEEDEEEEDGEF